mmetsp:Transcript_5194/g.14613  ORF Transcript_5194/g.14613 Transcript_5194/m.14613 type:complete len:185 (-) Transcript_5194:1060-1614(-)
MGLMFTKMFTDLFYDVQEEARILMVGLDGAGKTTILYKLKLGEVQNTVPTVGFNVETVEYGNVSFTVWDVGGQDKIRRLWKHYYDNARGVIFVVDSTDRDRVEEARIELQSLLTNAELNESAFLVLANKRDLPNAIPISELTEKLGLAGLPHTRKWNVTASCALSGEGLYEGLDWLTQKLKRTE